MKKCVLLFAVLIIALLIATLTDKTEQVAPREGVAVGKKDTHNLLVKGEVPRKQSSKEAR